MRNFNTVTQLKCITNSSPFKNKQDSEFNDFLQTIPHGSLLDLTERADNDLATYKSFVQYESGGAPWDVVVYTNTTKIIDLAATVSWVDAYADHIKPQGYFYLAINKWNMGLSNPDTEFSDLDYDHAIGQYVEKYIKRFAVRQYTFIPNDRGGLGNFVHGNNRFWLQRL